MNGTANMLKLTNAGGEEVDAPIDRRDAVEKLLVGDKITLMAKQTRAGHLPERI